MMGASVAAMRRAAPNCATHYCSVGVTGKRHLVVDTSAWHRLFAFDSKSKTSFSSSNDQQSIQDSSLLAETSEKYAHSSHN